MHLMFSQRNNPYCDLLQISSTKLRKRFGKAIVPVENLWILGKRRVVEDGYRLGSKSERGGNLSETPSRFRSVAGAFAGKSGRDYYAI